MVFTLIILVCIIWELDNNKNSNLICIKNNKIVHQNWNNLEHKQWMMKYGGNISNNLFRFSILNMIKRKIVLYNQNYQNYQNYSQNAIGYLIVPAANWIDGKYNNGGLADFNTIF